MLKSTSENILYMKTVIDTTMQSYIHYHKFVPNQFSKLKHCTNLFILYRLYVFN